MAEDKQFQASAKKKKKAEEDGQFARSRELTAALQLSACFLWILIIPFWGGGILDLYHKIIEDTDSFDVEKLFQAIRGASFVLLTGTGICFGLTSIAGSISELLQVGGLKFSFRHLKLDFSRLNPIKGILRILGEAEGSKAPMGLVIDSLKIGLVGGVVLLVLWVRVFAVAGSILEVDVSSPLVALGVLNEVILTLFRDLVILSLVYGIFTFWLSKRRIQKELMMDFEEVKRELKDDEGDPHVRSQRKSLHQEVLLHGMIENVRKAKVVIVSDS